MLVAFSIWFSCLFNGLILFYSLTSYFENFAESWPVWHFVAIPPLFSHSFSLADSWRFSCQSVITRMYFLHVFSAFRVIPVKRQTLSGLEHTDLRLWSNFQWHWSALFWEKSHCWVQPTVLNTFLCLFYLVRFLPRILLILLLTRTTGANDWFTWSQQRQILFGFNWTDSILLLREHIKIRIIWEGRRSILN